MLSEKNFKPMSDPIHVCPDILSDECLKIILSLGTTTISYEISTNNFIH